MTEATRRQIAQLVRANAELDAAAKVAENSVLAGFRKAEAYALRRTAELLATAPNFSKTDLQKRLAWYLQNIPSQELAGADSRYFAAVQSYVDKYDEIAKLAEKVLGAGGIGKDFTAIPKEFIDALKNRDLIQFADLNQAAHLRLDQQLLDAVVVGRTPAGALQQIKQTITGSYKWGKGRGLYEWHAGTYARTAQMRFARQTLKAKADELDLKEFLYVGPVDSKKRPFCLEIVGTVLNRNEIEDLDNGQTGDTFSDGGGYNCRDTWSPVDARFANKLKKEPQETKETVKKEAAKAAPKPKPAAPGKPAPDVLEKPPTNPQGWKPAKTVEEAQKWAIQRNLANKVDYGRLDVEAANELNRRVAAHLERFPDLRGRLDFLGSAQARYGAIVEKVNDAEYARLKFLYPHLSQKNLNRNVIQNVKNMTKNQKPDYVAAHYRDFHWTDPQKGPQFGFRGVVLNEKYFGASRKAYVEELKWNHSKGMFEKKKVLQEVNPIKRYKARKPSDISARWHPEGTESLASDIDHELGHLIDFMKYNAGQNSGPQNYTARDVFHKIYNRIGTENEMTDKLSRYAHQRAILNPDPKEMLAEAWSEFLNNPNPRPLAREICEELLRLIGKGT